MRLLLTVLSAQRSNLGERSTHAFDMAGGTIGRSANCEWSLPDASNTLSARHAAVSHNGHGFVVTDTSTNGVYLNSVDMPIGRGQSAPLAHGDTLYISDYVVSVALLREPTQAQQMPSLLTQPPALSSLAAGSMPSSGFPASVLSPLPAPGLSTGFGDRPAPARVGLSMDDLLGPPPARVTTVPPAPAVFAPVLPPLAPAVPAAPAPPPRQVALIPDDFDFSDLMAPAGGPVPAFAPAAPMPTTPTSFNAPLPPQTPLLPQVALPPLGAQPGGFGMPLPPAAPQAPLPPLSAPSDMPTSFGAPLPAQVQIPTDFGKALEASVAVPAAASSPGLDGFALPPLPAAPAAVPSGLEGLALPDLPPQPAPLPQAAVPPATASEPALDPLAMLRHRAIARAASIDLSRPTGEAPARPSEPAPRPAIAAVAMPGGGSADGDTDSTAFWQALGLDPASIPPATRQDMLAELGRAMRESASGLVAILSARKSLKDEFRIDQTRLAALENNPFKFFRSGDDALRRVIVEGKPGYLPLDRAVKQGFADIQAHEVATVVAMQNALRKLLAQMAPAAIENSTSPGLLGRKPDKSRLWERYVEAHGNLASDLDRTTREMLAEEFARAYAEQTQAAAEAGR